MIARARSQASFASGVEFRLDALDEIKASDFMLLVNEGLTLFRRVVITIRLPQDGGKYSSNREVRNRTLIELLKKLDNNPGNYIRGGSGAPRDANHGLFLDLEVEQAGTTDDVELCRLCDRVDARVIRSCHVFNTADWKGSDRIARTLKRIPEHELPKLALMLEDSRDLLELLKLAGNNRPGDQLVLGMGKWGIPSRCAPLAFGSLWTYAHDGSAEAAPGQLSAEYLSLSCRTGKHNADTRFFAIFGNPVMHSKSPEFHNKRFRDEGLNAAYIPFPLSHGELGIDFMNAFPLRAVSVTVPHKEATLTWKGALPDPSVSALGAANTAVLNGDEIQLFNTDVEGFLHPLLESGFPLSDSRCAVIGAGGAARAVVFALLQHSAGVIVYNRTEARAEQLCSEMAVLFPEADCRPMGLSPDLGAEAFDLIVQTTQVGMAPDAEADPISDYVFSGKETLYDIIYTPEYTSLLRRAQESGCRVITGRAMFEAQAAAQSRRFIAATN